jgi:hypothetical protein
VKDNGRVADKTVEKAAQEALEPVASDMNEKAAVPPFACQLGAGAIMVSDHGNR